MRKLSTKPAETGVEPPAAYTTMTLPAPGIDSGCWHWLMPKAPLKEPNYGAHFPRPRITLNSTLHFTLVGVRLNRAT
jgi:hypothetical protein